MTNGSLLHRLASGLRSVRLALTATALIGAIVTTPASAQMGVEHESSRESSSRRQPERIVFTVDVAEDFALFKPTFVKPTDTQPERGSFFVTEGNIYPAGTIQGNGAAFDPNTAGAIGRWFCRGTHLVSASEIPAAPVWVDTAQLYLLPRDTQSIATEGVEGGGTVVRIVTGGTGSLRGYVGEQRQEFLGFNPTGGVNLRVTFVLKKATN